MTCAAEDTPAAKRHDTVWLLFLIYLAYVIAFSLTPYAPTPELLGTRENATFEGLAGIGSSTNWDVITNVLLYVPFGALIVVFTRAWPRPPWVKTVGILAGALALSMLLEACQLFVRRFPSVSDVVWNSSGAVLGAIVGMLVIGPVGQTLHRRWRPTWTRPVLALLLAAYIAVLACAFSVTLPVSADFSNWEPSYRLQFGSDGRAAHPGRPALSLVAVYARALTSEDIALNFAATNNPDGSRTTKGLVAFYDFSPGADA